MEIDKEKILQRIGEKTKQKISAHRFQDTCAEISKMTGLAYGVCLVLWNQVGNDIYKIMAEIRQGEYKNPKAYILSLLKKK